MWRDKQTGEVKTEREIRAANKNVSYAKPFNPEGYDPVLPGAQPSVGKHEAVRRLDPVQDAKGNWVWSYETYSIIPDGDGAAVYLAKLKDDAGKSVKQTAEAKILAILPEYKQRNLTARAAEIAIIRQSRPWTDDEVAEYTVGQALWDRIKAIRAYSNQLEAQLDAATTIEEFDAIDITAGWPE